MPAKPSKSNPDRPAVIVLRLPGKYKNAIIDHAQQLGVPYTNWCVETLITALNNQQGHPPPPPPAAPLPTPQQQLHAYLTGQKLLLPCGQTGTQCPGTTNPEKLGSHHYCPQCKIRVT